MDSYQSRPRDKIVEQIECYIIEHNLKPGDSLPSERQLCELWDCNRMTFRAAAKRLITEGVLNSIPLKNYYVAPDKLERYLQDLTSLTEFVQQQGLQLSNRLISQSIIPAGRKTAQQLKVPEKSDVLELIRLRLVEEEPISIDTSLIPLTRFRGIETYDFEHASLYSVMDQVFHIVPDHGSEEISITYADEEEAKLLQIDEGEALFYLKGATYDKNDESLEIIKSVIRTDRIRFAGELRKDKEQ